jgi:protein-tyrosine phosphatase
MTESTAPSSPEPRPGDAPPPAPAPLRVLFVCLGNICRSPLAEGVFRKKVRAAGLEGRIEIASAGTGDWHIGAPPDERMQATAQRYGLDLSHLRGEQLAASDLRDYHHVFVMDRQNLLDALTLDPEGDYGDRVRLFREFDPEPEDFQVPDPYYGDGDGFERVYEIVDRTCGVILRRLRAAYDWS